MKIVLVGASGYLGGAAAKALEAAGHRVAGVARSEQAGAKLRQLGYEVVPGDVERPESLGEAAAGADAVLYCVQLNADDAPAIEARALTALVEAVGKRRGTLLYTSGVWFYGPTGTRVADETWPANPPAAVAARPRLEQIVADGVKSGARSIIVRPGDVYGAGGGLPAMFVQSARESGAARTIGDGANHMPVIHVDDLGRLFVLALEKAQAGDVFNATDDSAYTQLEIARAASRGAGRDGATTAWPIAAASAAMGHWIEAFAMDQRVTSAKARRALGWEPSAPSILEDLERGSYVAATAP